MRVTDATGAMIAELLKLAEEEQPLPPHPLLTAAKHVGGFGLGTLAGIGAVHGANYTSNKILGTPLITSTGARAAIPVLAGVGALATQVWQGGLMERLRQDSAERLRRRRDGTRT